MSSVRQGRTAPKKLAEATVLVIGLGQIGGSIAAGLTRDGSVSEVIGYDIDKRVSSRARHLGIIGRSATKLESAIPLADLVILATPIRETITLLPRFAGHLRKDAVCLDVASTKAQIVKAASDACPSMNFVGGHPIAGSEKAGIGGLSPDKFRGKTFVLTPTRRTNRRSLRLVMAVVRALGGRPLILSPGQHDKLVSLTIGLPHALAITLIHLADRASGSEARIRKLAGGSFQSATRVAGSPSHLIADLLFTNRAEVLGSLDRLTSELATLRRKLITPDNRDLASYVVAAHRKSRRFQPTLKSMKVTR